MKPEELRLGNYVVIDGSIQQVYEIKQDSINGHIPQEVDPVPLTEEWLLKFGFEYLANEQYEKHHLNLYFNWDKDTGLFLFIEDSTESLSFKHIKHVHQLQNIYFALTGEELEIK